MDVDWKGIVTLGLPDYFVCFCRLSMVGLAVSLADNETFATRSTLELVANHCSEPLIPRSDLMPVWSSLCFPVSFVQILGRLKSVVVSFVVNSCWSIWTEKSLF